MGVAAFAAGTFPADAEGAWCVCAVTVCLTSRPAEGGIVVDTEFPLGLGMTTISPLVTFPSHSPVSKTLTMGYSTKLTPLSASTIEAEGLRGGKKRSPFAP